MRPGFFLTPDTWHLESEHGLLANWWKYHVNPMSQIMKAWKHLPTLLLFLWCTLGFIFT